MYYYIKGIAVVCEPNLVVLEAAGVGYAINTSFHSASAAKVGEETVFYTYLHVAEDLFKLYGFRTQDELTCFKQLLGVSGVGPKAALSILGAVTPEKLAACIATGDEAPICAAQGVGKKLAQRIILDLKDKLSFSADPSAIGKTEPVSGGDAAVRDAIAALTGLGYQRPQIMSALSGVDTKGLTAEEIIRAAFKKLVKI